MAIKSQKRIFLSPPHLSGEELQYIQKAFEQNWVAPIGENLDKFEEAICDFTLSESALAVSSGTAAIHLALRVLGVGKGDVVICPTFTFVATANPILYQQATPIFVDSELFSWNISVEYAQKAIETCIKKGKKPKAIILVHTYGNPADIVEFSYLANEYEIPLIEDAAEALGSTFRGKPLGTLGELGIFSFNGNKIITTSSGGMLVSDNPNLIQKALYYATQAKDLAPHYQHSEVGYNYRMSNILAGIGLGQMEVLEERIQKRRANFDFYYQNFPQLGFQNELYDMLSNRWLSCVLFEDFAQREKIRKALADENIESRPLWKPLHLQPIFQHCVYFGESVAEDLFQRGLCLPSGTQLTEDDLERIADVIRENL